MSSLVVDQGNRTEPVKPQPISEICGLLMSCLTNQSIVFNVLFFFFLQNTAETLFSVISPIDVPASSFSCFPDSSFWPSEAESFHTPHIYKLLVSYVIWKDNMLSDRDMVFEICWWEVLELRSCVQVGVHGALETGTNMLLINYRFKQTKRKKGANLTVLLLF